ASAATRAMALATASPSFRYSGSHPHSRLRQKLSLRYQTDNALRTLATNRAGKPRRTRAPRDRQRPRLELRPVGCGLRKRTGHRWTDRFSAGYFGGVHRRGVEGLENRAGGLSLGGRPKAAAVRSPAGRL